MAELTCFLFAWRSPVFDRKNRSNFGEDLFFFWRPLVFGRKNRLNSGEDPFFWGGYLFSAEKIISILFKTDENLGQVRLLIFQASKKPSPFCEILATLLLRIVENCN